MPPKDFVPTVIYAITDDNEAIEIGNCKTVEELTAQFERWDFVRVTRCKDCKWYGIYEAKKDGTPDKRYSPSVCLREIFAKRRDPDWYCADGERKENKDEYN